MAGVNTNSKLPELRSLKKDELERLVLRHEEQKATDRPLYAAAKAELERRSAGQLDVKVTIDHLMACARSNAYTTYGDIARVNGVEWRIVRRLMPLHLEKVLAECHEREWPLLSAICVNADELASGDLSGKSLDGFVAGVERVTKTKIENPKAFLKQVQRECFSWAAKRHATTS
jgi:hypothetical protein